MKKVISLVLLAAYFLCTLPAPARAEKQSIAVKRGMVVAKAALYGFGGGLVVGLASQVFKKKAKNIFMFGSLGMYAGVLLGIYVISTSKAPTPYEGPDTYEDFSLRGPDPALTVAAASSSIRSTELSRKYESDRLEVNFLSLKF